MNEYNIALSHPATPFGAIDHPPTRARDQGGKHAHLVVSVRLVTDAIAQTWTDPQPGEQFQMGDLPDLGESPETETYMIPLKVTLLYESGHCVTDAEILRLMHTEDSMPSLSLRFKSGNGKGSPGSWRFEGDVHYRLEKVSLRNDGRRFKVAIDIDDSNQAASELEELATSAVSGSSSSNSNSNSSSRSSSNSSSSSRSSDAVERHQRLTKWLGMVRGCTSCPVTVLSKRKHGNTGGAAGGRALASQESPARGVLNSPPPKRARRNSFGFGGIGSPGGVGVGGVGGGGGGGRLKASAECDDMNSLWASTPEEYSTTPLNPALIMGDEHHPMLDQLRSKFESFEMTLASMVTALDKSAKKLELLEAVVLPLTNQFSSFLSSISQVSGTTIGSGSRAGSNSVTIHYQSSNAMTDNTPNESSIGSFASSSSSAAATAAATAAAAAAVASAVASASSSSSSSSSSPASADTTIVPPWALRNESAAVGGNGDGSKQCGVRDDERCTSADIARSDDECMSHFLATSPEKTAAAAALQQSLPSQTNIESLPEGQLSMPMPLSQETDRKPSWGPIIKTSPENHGTEMNIGVETNANPNGGDGKGS